CRGDARRPRNAERQLERDARSRDPADPGRPPGTRGRGRRGGGLPLLAGRKLHHRTSHQRQRREQHAVSTHATDINQRLLVRLEVEEFLFEEAALLDDWRLDDWLALFTKDCRYVVPSTDKPDGDPASDLTLVDD